MPQNISPSEFHLIKKEVETFGESLSQERLERTADIDQLRLEFKALRKALDTLLPPHGALEKAYVAAYDELRQIFNPESKAG